MQKRAAFRKKVEGITVCDVSILKPFCPLTKKATLVNASSKDFLILIQRKDLIPKYFRHNLTLQDIVNTPLVLTIEQMDLTLSGYITRTAMIGKGLFEVAVDYSQDSSDYFRECLFDCLPNQQGEFDDVSTDQELPLKISFHSK